MFNFTDTTRFAGFGNDDLACNRWRVLHQNSASNVVVVIKNFALKFFVFRKLSEKGWRRFAKPILSKNQFAKFRRQQRQQQTGKIAYFFPAGSSSSRTISYLSDTEHFAGIGGFACLQPLCSTRIGTRFQNAHNADQKISWKILKRFFLKISPVLFRQKALAVKFEEKFIFLLRENRMKS